MKVAEVAFTKPKKVFQVFRKIHLYGKEEKSFADRKEEMSWKSISSKSGYVKENTLYLPEGVLKNPDLKTCELVTMEDNNPSSNPKNTGSGYNRCFSLARSVKLDIFELKKGRDIELHLRYGYFAIGIPGRKNFRLCFLKKNAPVEIKINGKTDFSMSSGRARIFIEQEYIFEYLGEFRKCKILKEPYEPLVKEVPIERKVVDLVKRLW